MSKSNIGWTESTCNFYTWNCTPMSPGCAFCYARSLAALRPRNAHQGDFLAPPALRENAWKELPRLKPGPVFVNSMSDTYHEAVPLAWIHRIHNTARQYPRLIFLLLTKRIERAAALAPYLDWPPNLWIGTTVENADYLWRLDYLRSITEAAGRFVSFEPLLDYPPLLKDGLAGIEWVIVGGESGPKRRPFQPDWARRIKLAADHAGIPFFYKQGSALWPGQDRILDGRTWDGVPAGWGWQPEHAEPPRPTGLVQLPLFAGDGAL
jgi:protein gp37